MNPEDSKSAVRRAILIAPWVVVPIVAVALRGGPHHSRLELIVSGILMGTLFGVPLAYLAVLVAGLPAYKLLKVCGALNGGSLCAVGAFIGGIGGYVFVGREAIALCAISGLGHCRNSVVDNQAQRMSIAARPNKLLHATCEDARA